MNDQTNTTPVPVNGSADSTPATASTRRRDPFSMLNDIEIMMDRMLSRRWPLLRSALPGMSDFGADWVPHVDMYERGNDLVIKAELPGVSKDDIDVSIEQGDLVIRGERRTEHEVKDERAYRMERSFGSFYRRLPLPEGVREDEISATYSDGVLEIRTPRSQTGTSSPKKIAIR